MSFHHRAEVNAMWTLGGGIASIAAFALGTEDTTTMVIGILASVACTGYLCRKAASGRSAAKLIDIATRSDDMRGKICIVTGANAGIGFHTAKRLVQTGAVVVITCRNSLLLEKTSSKIKSELRAEGHVKNKDGVVPNLISDMIPMDLDNVDTIKMFAESFNRRFPRLDILVNNAGMMTKEFDEIEEEGGFERHTIVNFLGPVYLTELLLAKIKQCSGRVVNVSSTAHRLPQTAGFTHADLLKLLAEVNDRPVPTASPTLDYSSAKLTGKGAGTKKSFLRYGLSKLLNIYFSHYLVQQGVKSCALHPGVVASNFALALIPQNIFNKLYYASLAILKTSEEGAQTSIYCALCEDSELSPYEYKGSLHQGGYQYLEPSGRTPTVGARYFVDCKDCTNAGTYSMAKDLELGRLVMEWSKKELDTYLQKRIDEDSSDSE